MDYVLIAAGLVLLFIGGEILVRGSVGISKKLGISRILIGIVVVGFGTSAPELLVSVKAALENHPDIALGNVVGSNIANVLLILGVASLIAPIKCTDKAIFRDSLAVVVASCLLYGLTFYGIMEMATGIVMLTLLGAYLFYSYKAEKADKHKHLSADGETVHEHEAHEFEDMQLGLFACSLFCVVGIGMLVFGADMLVEGATNVALALGVSEAVIGLSLIALGTSLPELATAVVASRHKQTDVVIGNVLGSNLFNILTILGITSIITPLPLAGRVVETDILIMLAVVVAVPLLIAWLKTFRSRLGIVFTLLYVAYISWLYLSGGTAL